MKLVWYVGIAFCGAGFLIVFLEKEIPLRTELETDFGMVDKAVKKDKEDKPVQVV